MNTARKIFAFAAVMAAALAPVSRAADYYWTGAASSAWNATDKNWAVGSASGAASAWVDGNNAVFPASASAKAITVSADVSAGNLKFGAGDWSLTGSQTLTLTSGQFTQLTTDPVSLTLKDGLTVSASVAIAMNLQRFNIRNATMKTTARFHNNWSNGQSKGVISIFDGGTLNANDFVLSPETTSAGWENYVVNIYTNGVFNPAAGLYVANNVGTKRYGTIHVDGGSINGANLLNADSLSVKMTLGPGGVHFLGTSTQRFLGQVSGDGAVFFDKTGTTYAGVSGTTRPENSYTGGTVFTKGGTTVFSTDRNLGAVPASPLTNLSFNAAATFSLLSQGAVDLSANRTILLNSGATLRIAANDADRSKGYRMSIHGRIVGSNPSANPNGIVSTDNAYWDGPLFIEPEAGVENEFGCLIVKNHSLTIGGEGRTTLTYSTAAAENGSTALVVTNSTLTVTGGVLRVVAPEGKDNKYTSNYGNVVVSGGELDLSAQTEYLNAFRVPGTTTVERAGIMKTGAFRLGEGTLPTPGLLRLKDGGTLVVKRIYMTSTSGILRSTGQIDWDGGILAPTEKNNDDWLGVGSSASDYASWLEKVHVYALEGGAVVSNNVELRIRQPILSGAASDGGFTKWGTGMIAFVGTGTEAAPFNSFNGPVTVRQGTLTMGSAWNFPKTAELRVASGATFNGNDTAQAFATVAGTGRITNPSKLTVTGAIAPGIDGNAGTLTIDGAPASIAGCALRIGASADGAEVGKLALTGALDLSQLTLEVTGLDRLDTNAAAGKYVIATATQGISGEFASSNLPANWTVKVSGNTAELRPNNPFVLVVR